MRDQYLSLAVYISNVITLPYKLCLTSYPRQLKVFCLKFTGDYKCVHSLVTNTELQPTAALVSFALVCKFSKQNIYVYISLQIHDSTNAQLTQHISSFLG